MLSKPSSAAAAGGTGCYINAPSSSSSAEIMSPESHGVRGGAEVTRSGQSRARHQQHRPRATAAEPGYMQMTRAASVRSRCAVLMYCVAVLTQLTEVFHSS